MTSQLAIAVYYLDASALVKRYTTETGSGWVQNLCQPATDALMATARVTQAEAAAAFASKLRQGGVEIDQALVDLAVDLTRRQRLRGYDAVQLAAALTLQGLLTQTPRLPFMFIAADDDLLEAARDEGLTTDNPHQYP